MYSIFNHTSKFHGGGRVINISIKIYFDFKFSLEVSSQTLIYFLAKTTHKMLHT